jgi:hypothetical protein
MSNAPAAVIDLSTSSWMGEPAPDPGLGLSAAEQAELEQALAETDAELAAATSAAYQDFDATFSQQAAQDAARDQARADADLFDLTSPARTDETVLTRAVSRIGQGIYGTPAALSFSQPGQDAIELANDRAAITGHAACGQVDDFGRCTSRFHALTCDHGTSSADTHAEVAASGAYERALSNFGGLALANSASGPAILADAGDPGSAYPVPQLTIELAHGLAEGWGLHDSEGPGSMLRAPAGPLDTRQALADGYAGLSGEPGLSVPREQRPGYPGIRELAQGLGLA